MTAIPAKPVCCCLILPNWLQQQSLASQPSPPKGCLCQMCEDVSICQGLNKRILWSVMPLLSFHRRRRTRTKRYLVPSTIRRLQLRLLCRMYPDGIERECAGWFARQMARHANAQESLQGILCVRLCALEQRTLPTVREWFAAPPRKKPSLLEGVQG